ncbi:RNA helicase domain-containing protein [Vibrio alginolyticus]|uniref:hypothetical protein n=1 Tax=Vibrio parahaemolyticus TaxID=670 RepID=UPI001D16D670|nr:hypothetical protein [Vibrio parahaemolyticus]MCR9673546.1 RNA helicase domain-containing protein [Vibrio alginolyticus]MDF5222482.1 hypothetical protein [Vibrio parahaemolyticus]
MSGQDGNRGYLVQSIIGLLESLKETGWSKVTIEADHISDKVDVAWHGKDRVKVSQVKSSINQISKANALKWAIELEESCQADEYTLILIGPCSSSVARIERHNNVVIPCPKSLDIKGLLAQACHLLSAFLEENQISVPSFLHREAIANALVTKLSTFASDGTSLSRNEFVKLLIDWSNSISPTTNYMWEQVDFSKQRGIENAIAGKRLGPSDVVHCPELSICSDIKVELDRSHLYWITGKQGCGKSITAWQVAKKLYDEGYVVWRPDYSSNPAELLKSLANTLPTVLVIDDAQQYPQEFIERLSEKSSPTLKIIFSSTFIEFHIPSPALISPSLANEEIKAALLHRKKEVQPIVQQFDEEISDSYMGTSLERRLEQCSQQSSPWEFFWILRGGWRTARKEFESIQQIPNANYLLSVIAATQISSCDAGSSRVNLEKYSALDRVTSEQFDRAISRLSSLGLVIISDDIFRTKHISYANRVITECFSQKNYSYWPYYTKMTLSILLDDSTTLKGVYWLLSAIDLTDATRFDNKRYWHSMLKPLKTRCKREWKKSEWAIGCYYYLMRFFGISNEELINDEEILLEWFSAGFGSKAIFSKNIANELINLGNNEESSVSSIQVKSLFEKVDYNKVVQLANKMSVDDFYSFGELVNRLSFFQPNWTEQFIASFDWDRSSALILNAGTEHQYSVDKLIESVFVLANIGRDPVDYRFVTDSIPFIIKCYEHDPINSVNALDGIFWRCLGFGPHFLRGGKDPSVQQLRVAKDIISKLSPALMAKAMNQLVSRDLENLARSLSIIKEVDESFLERVVIYLNQEEFNKAIYSDWKNQSNELQHLIRFFCVDNSRQPARSWISLNKDIMEGALRPIFIGIAPEVAVGFFKEDKQLRLFNKRNRWPEMVFALATLAEYDVNNTIEIVNEYMDDIEDTLYKLSLDSPKLILNFFRILHSLSIDLYSDLISRINLKDPRALKTIKQLTEIQDKERQNYLKLARLAMGLGGRTAILGHELNDQLRKS